MLPAVMSSRVRIVPTTFKGFNPFKCSPRLSESEENFREKKSYTIGGATRVDCPAGFVNRTKRGERSTERYVSPGINSTNSGVIPEPGVTYSNIFQLYSFSKLKGADGETLWRTTPHHGHRVIVGQRMLQATGDPLLGYTTIDGREYFVRQMKNMKASMPLEWLTGEPFYFWVYICGGLLARAHSRIGDAAKIAGYCGKSKVLDESYNLSPCFSMNY